MKTLFSNMWKGPGRASKTQISTDPRVLIEWEKKNRQYGFYPHKRGVRSPSGEFITYWENSSWPPTK